MKGTYLYFLSRILPIGCRGGDWIFGVGGGKSDEK
jgi:hypothetical protein